MNKVSFIVPAFNSEKTIEECIRSILVQEGEKVIIVVDNGSKDNTLEIVNRLAEKHPEIMVLREAKRGPAAAKNKGLEIATGDYIAFVDSDVVLPPTWLSNALKKLKSDDSLAAVGGPGKGVKKNPISDSLDKLLFGKGEDVKGSYVDSLATMDALYRSDVIKGMRFEESLIAGEDPDFNFRLRKKSYKLLYTVDLFVYHHHPLNLRNLLKKWYNYGTFYTQLYKRHPEFKDKGYYVRILFMPLFITSTILSILLHPIWFILAFTELLMLFFSYVYIGFRVKGGFLFPFVHTLKQFAQMSGIMMSMLKKWRINKGIVNR